MKCQYCNAEIFDDEICPYCDKENTKTEVVNVDKFYENSDLGSIKPTRKDTAASLIKGFVSTVLAIITFLFVCIIFGVFLSDQIIDSSSRKGFIILVSLALFLCTISYFSSNQIYQDAKKNKHLFKYSLSDKLNIFGIVLTKINFISYVVFILLFYLFKIG